MLIWTAENINYIIIDVINLKFKYFYDFDLLILIGLFQTL